MSSQRASNACASTSFAIGGSIRSSLRPRVPLATFSSTKAVYPSGPQEPEAIDALGDPHLEGSARFRLKGLREGGAAKCEEIPLFARFDPFQTVAQTLGQRDDPGQHFAAHQIEIHFGGRTRSQDGHCPLEGYVGPHVTPGFRGDRAHLDAGARLGMDGELIMAVGARRAATGAGAARPSRHDVTLSAPQGNDCSR